MACASCFGRLPVLLMKLEHAVEVIGLEMIRKLDQDLLVELFGGGQIALLMQGQGFLQQDEGGVCLLVHDLVLDRERGRRNTSQQICKCPKSAQFYSADYSLKSHLYLPLGAASGVAAFLLH